MSTGHSPLPIDLDPRLRLRTIGEGDLELLRQWKNRNRLRFFHQDEISAEQQRRWFDSFCAREDDFMMIVEADGEPVGCMGYRVNDDAIDVYNVIRGIPGGPPGTMRLALAGIIREAQRRYPAHAVCVQVLSDNPAVDWYTKSGFVVVRDAGTHLIMQRNHLEL